MRMTLAEMKACVEKIQDHGSSVTIAQRDDLIRVMWSTLNLVAGHVIEMWEARDEHGYEYDVEHMIAEDLGIKLSESVSLEEYEKMLEELMK